MALVVIKTREQLAADSAPIEHNPDGTLTRAGAVIASRKLWGDLGTISSDERMPRLIWCIGRFGQTVGRGRTWEIALARSEARKKKLDQKMLAAMRAEAADIPTETPIVKEKFHAPASS